ncbi:MAG: hypothetical protein E6H10_05495 [Bacteroidetes bacterium]|nr:MAG: hypothetical protein E6H10_05495 [Bacteroidota bacterium]
MPEFLKTTAACKFLLGQLRKIDNSSTVTVVKDCEASHQVPSSKNFVGVQWPQMVGATPTEA